MPIQDCSVGSKRGKRYGKSGKCYTGPNAYRKAAAQAAAIKASGYQENRLNSLVRRDPTRTTMLRKRFALAMRGRFRKLEKEIVELVEKTDVFGLGSSDYYPVLHHYPGGQDHDQSKHGNRRKELDTPEFKKWFRESKVVDDEGNPLVVYHGTATEFEEFTTGISWFSESTEQAEAYAYARATYGKDPNQVPDPAHLKPVFLSIQNPAEVPERPRFRTIGRLASDLLNLAQERGNKFNMQEARQKFLAVRDYWRRIGIDSSEIPVHDHWFIPGKIGSDHLEEFVKSLGFDGFKFTEGGNVTYGAFDPTQIKSATGNRGTFDPNDPVITHKVVLHHLPGQHDQKKHGNRTGRATDTPEFKKWFGESKVVDDEGNPLSVYHGTLYDVEDFEHKTEGQEEEGYGVFDQLVGAHFAEDPALTEAFTISGYKKLHDYSIDYYDPSRSWYRDPKTHKVIYGSDPEFKAITVIKKGDTGEVEPYDIDKHGGMYGLRDKYGSGTDVYMLRAGGRTMPLYLSIQNPLEMPTGSKAFDQTIIPQTVASVVLPRDRQLFIDAVGRSGYGNKKMAGDMWDAFDAGKPYKGTSSYDSYKDMADFISDRGSTLFNNGEMAIRAKNLLMEMGYDGIKYKNTSPTEVREGINPTCWIAFKATQIKSVSGNRGTFDPDDPIVTHHLPGQHDQKEHGNWARGIDVGTSKRMDSPSRWKDPNEVIQAIEQASKASPEDIASGKVPLVRRGDSSKFSALTLAQYQQDGTVVVTDGFFERSEYSRQLLMAHEFGHEVAMRALSGNTASERTKSVLEPFRAKAGYEKIGWVEYRYNNFAGASSLPEEMLADVYTNVTMFEKPPWVEYLPSGKPLPVLAESKKYIDVYKHVIAVADRAGLPLPEWAADPNNFEITENIVQHHWKGHPEYDHDQGEHDPNKGGSEKPKKEKPDARDVASVEEFRKYLEENAEQWFLDEDDIERLIHKYTRSGIADRLETMEASGYPMTLDTSPIDLKMTGPKETERARLLPAYDDRNKLWQGKIPIDPEDTLFVKHETTSRWEKEFMELGFDTRSAPPDTRLGRVTVTEGGGLKQSTIEEAGLFIEPNTYGDYRYGVIIQLKAKQVKPTIESLGLGYKTGLEGLYGAKDAMIAGEVIPPENIVGIYAYEGKPVWKPNPKNPNSDRLYIGENGKLDYREKTENIVGNTWWSFLTKSNQMKYFATWLGSRVASYLFGEDVVDSLWMGFINQGFERGLGNAFDSVRKYKWDTGEVPFYAGARQQFIADSFSQPTAAEKVELLLARFMTGLQGVSDEMSARMGYKLADGLARGSSPRKVARELAKELKISREKAIRLTRTENTRAHAEGQLVALRQLGVEEVGVMVEWSVSGLGTTKKGYASPCKLCAELKGVVLTLDQAEGLIPRHENCMCSFVPANVGESTKGQKRKRQAVRKAIKKSLAKEKKSRWAGKELVTHHWKGHSLYDHDQSDHDPNKSSCISYIAKTTGSVINDVGGRDELFGKQINYNFGKVTVQTWIRETANEVFLNSIASKKTVELATSVKGSGKGTLVLETLKKYCDKHKKKLVVPDATEPAMPYWEHISWLERDYSVVVMFDGEPYRVPNTFSYTPEEN